MRENKSIDDLFHARSQSFAWCWSALLFPSYFCWFFQPIRERLFWSFRWTVSTSPSSRHLRRRFCLRHQVFDTRIWKTISWSIWRNSERKAFAPAMVCSRHSPRWRIQITSPSPQVRSIDRDLWYISFALLLGMFEEDHGIIHNYFYDRVLNKTISMGR